MNIREKAKDLPVIGNYDVIVVGGGIAGISAALSAARNGSEVLLIEREYALGGLATLGLVTIYLPLCDGKGNQIVKGIGEELLKLSISVGAEKDLPQAWRNYFNGVATTKEERKKKRCVCRFNASVFSILSEKLLLDSKVKILYGTQVVDALKKRNKIEYIITENRDGRCAYKVKSVVDASGDAVVANVSGAQCETYKKGNILAYWYYYGNKKDINDLKPLGFSDSVCTQDLIDKENKKKYLSISAEEVNQQVIDSHEGILKDFLRDGDISATHTLNSIATIPQIRMTRKIVAPVKMSLSDNGKKVKDSVGLFSNWTTVGPIYELSLGALYSINIRNLIAAGRCISADEDMWDVTRAIPVCAVSGEAAGLAASMSDDFRKLSVKKIQDVLLSRGIQLHF